MSIAELLEAYLAARGMQMPVDLDTTYLLGEVDELQRAIDQDDPAEIRCEVADVVLSAAVLARAYDTTIEDCIREKTAKDTGRADREALGALDAAKEHLARTGVTE